MTDQALRNTLQNLFIGLCSSKDCEDLQQFGKGFSQDELEFCQILNWVMEAFRACYWMKKSFKLVIE